MKPIHTETEYKAAMFEIEHLWDATEGSSDADNLEMLVILVEAYEKEHYPIDPPDPIEAIKFRMEQEGLTRRELGECLGARGRVSEIMNRKRPLSLTMIRRINEKLHIPASLLIADYHVSRGVLAKKTAKKIARKRRPTK